MATLHQGEVAPVRLQQRIVWTAQPDGSVRQIWSSSEDGGASWSVVFDGRYVLRR